MAVGFMETSFKGGQKVQAAFPPADNALFYATIPLFVTINHI
ncbi:hypothetical protein NEIELOOT_03099 [Neisseria elongata subsp. glycolytica ATCC 29315]|uniref:Uncharacterized protein n=1 Tax=Neisseria elongata subsp. glycolytica ATCC 29315 TaxID=546263 RepID=D4DVI1_NEIEG|nr:hypothetical protein NEIELOOT_03099 [Neisseria elongata subsp. glycolytica ATCC 29315]